MNSSTITKRAHDTDYGSQATRTNRPRMARPRPSSGTKTSRQWEVLHRVHLAHDADPSEPDEWRKADEGSQEKDLLDHYEKAMGVLAIALQ